MKHTVAIAVSGGVDSLVAAYLLKKQGWHTFGLHFITGFETTTADMAKADDKRHPLRRIGEQLDMPIHIVDCRQEFSSEVVTYFCEAYAHGRTPNPCLVCNPRIKFGRLLDFAMDKGATALATGHYARIEKDEDGGFHLFKGADTAKDQSYFLAFLNQSQLSRAVFPLGQLTKQAVRSLAAENNLIPVAQDESQDVCFIKGQTYGEFLNRWGKLESKPGIVEDMQGKAIGEHKGLHLFTIGQRKGINCPAAAPYYVVRINPAENRLTVGTKNDLVSEACKVSNLNWIREPKAPAIRARVKLRYRHQAAAATVMITDNSTATVHFDSPQSAVTPGQGAVFYNEDEVLGGGWIEA